MQQSFFCANAQKFIKGSLLATSEFRNCDSRTATSYFIGEDDKVHSTDRNYSMLYSNAKPLTIEDFIALWEIQSPRYAIARIF